MAVRVILVNRDPNTSGFGITNALAGLGLVMVMALGLSYFMKSRNEELLNLRAVSTRDSLMELYKKYAGDLKALRASTAYLPPSSNADGNAALLYCLEGVATAPPACAPNCCNTTASPQPFNLIDPLASGTAILAGTDASANTSAAPARFDAHGEPCTNPSSSCSLEFVATFTADCAPQPSPCATANTLSIQLTAREAVDAMGNPYSKNRALTRSVTTNVQIK